MTARKRLTALAADRGWTTLKMGLPTDTVWVRGLRWLSVVWTTDGEIGDGATLCTTHPYPLALDLTDARTPDLLGGTILAEVRGTREEKLAAVEAWLSVPVVPNPGADWGDLPTSGAVFEGPDDDE